MLEGAEVSLSFIPNLSTTWTGVIYIPALVVLLLGTEPWNTLNVEAVWAPGDVLDTLGNGKFSRPGRN